MVEATPQQKQQPEAASEQGQVQTQEAATTEVQEEPVETINSRAVTTSAAQEQAEQEEEEKKELPPVGTKFPAVVPTGTSPMPKTMRE